MTEKSVVFKKQPTLASEVDKYFMPTTFLETQPPKVVTGSYAAKRFVGGVTIPDDFYDYKPGKVETFVRGVSDTLDDLTTYGSKLEVYGGQGVMALGDFLGSEKVSTVGLEMIQNAQENIDYMAETNRYAPKELQDSFLYNLGGGATNYALVFATGGAVGAVAKTLGATATVAKTAASAGVFTSMFGLEAGSESQEKIEKYKQDTGDIELKNYTPEMAGKNFAASTIYSLGSAAAEKWAFKEQKILFENKSTFLKTAIKAGLTEGGTEALQEALNIGIDFADGTIDYNMLPDRLKGMIMEAAVGATLGFTAGVGSSYYQRSNAIKELKKNLSNVVPAQDLEAVATEIADKSIETLQGVIATETKLSTELRTKHGDIYNSLVVAISDAMKDSGAFTDMSEADFAQYVSETAKIQADVVLAEANKRNIPIDDVIRASEIRYEDGEIKLGERGINVVSQRVFDRLEQKIAEMQKTLEDNANPQEQEFIKAELDKLIQRRESWLKKKTLSQEEFKKLDELTEGKAKAMLDDFDAVLTEDGYTPDQDKEAFVVQKYGQEVADIMKNAKPAISKERTLLKESMDLANENARLDEIYPEYKGETIIVDGKERTVYNSNGDRIAKSAEALTNFWKWFGDSKVVDGGGRPLVVYHGTDEKFDVFDREKIKNTALGEGFYFGTEQLAKGYTTTDNLMAVYLKIENPVDSSDETNLISPEVFEQIADYFSENFIETEDGFNAFFDNVNYTKTILKDHNTRQNIDFILDFAQYSEKDIKTSEVQTTINNIIKETTGIDGFKVGDVWVVFNPNQIKSINNRGTYSLEEKNIYWKWSETQKDSGVKFSKSTEDVKRLIKNINPTDDFRLLYDANKGVWLYADSEFKIHHDMFFDSWNAGLYPELKNSYDARLYYDELTYNDELGRFIVQGYENNNYMDRINEMTDDYAYAYIIDNGEGKGAILFARYKGDIEDAGIGYLVEDAKLYNMTTGEFENVLYHHTPNGGKSKGAYHKNTIYLFENADLATLPHEFAHFWLDNMWTYANSEAASDAYKEQMKAVWNFLGVKDPKQKLTSVQHERFATAYERYLWNGDLPSPIIGAAFDDYDRWLQSVYNTAKDIKYMSGNTFRTIRITPEITNWFKSMTTGVIDPTPSVATPKQIMEERKELVKSIDNEAKEVVLEKKMEYNAKPVNVDGKMGYSKVSKRHAQMLGIDSDLSTTYSVADMEKQNEKARDFVSKNPEQAQRIVDGLESAPEGILKNAIYNAYLEAQMKIGNTGAYLDALRNQSLELTRYGQEIASQRGAVDSLFDPAYWIRHIEENKRIKLATRVSSLSDLATGNPVEKLNQYLDDKVKKATEAVLAAQSAEEQQKIAQKLAEDIAEELSVDDETYFQEEIPEEVNTETSAYNYIMKTVEDRLGLSVSQADAEQIMNKANSIKSAMENSVDETGNPSVLYFKNMSEMEDFANSLSPSPQLAVMTSIFGRGNMLASPKSVLLNIESNLINFITEAGVRRAGNIALGKTAVSAVSKEAKNEYMKYSRDVYKASGYTISTMDELNTRKFVRGEQIISSAGEGLGRKIGQFYEQTVFKYLMGYPDAVFKDFTFVDSVSLQATDIALQEGLSGQELEKRATEIFKDATLVEPKTDTGKEIRKQAVEQAMVATYTNEGFISTTVSRLRDVLNKASGNLRIGDLISPFVKTPANVISLGLEYSAGSAIAIKNIKTIVGDFQTGNISEKTIKSLKSLERNAIGFVLAALLAASMDDDDYIPPYDMLSPSERSLVKQQNGVYNSIKIGNRYVSLDYFGPLAIPMTAILMAKSKRGSVEKITGYAKGVGYQALNIPVIGDFREVLEGYHGNVSRGDSEKILQNITDTVVDFLSARTIPAFVSDIAKASDPYERETYNKAINRVLAKIPVARQTLEPRVSTFTGKTEERAENVVVRALTDIFAGSRVKKQTKGAISTEIQSLYEDDARVSLSDIARSGDLSKLSEETKKKVRREFAQMYAEEVKKLISRESYMRKDSQEKADSINKIRSKIASKLKRKYKEEIRKNKLK